MKLNVLLSLLTSVALLVAAGCSTASKKETSTEEETSPSEPPKVKPLERIKPPAMITNPQERADYLVIHFWDGFDFTDTLYCHAPDVTDQAMVDYMSLFPYTTPSYRLQSVKNLLDSAQVSQTMYNYFFRTAEHYLYDPNSQMRNDEFFMPFLEHVVNSPLLDETSKIRPAALLELVCKNRPGTPAMDFNYTTASGASGSLYGIKAELLLLMFYNPGCSECKRTVEEFKNSPAVTAAVASGKLKLLLVYTDKDLELWKSHRKEIPAQWINGYDKEQSVRNKQLYDLKAIPTLFLLDSEKRVILKDASSGAINNYLTNNN